ncbi:MAG: hypothetical protein WC199_09795 [Dysgonamonadaceae bacterium]
MQTKKMFFPIFSTLLLFILLSCNIENNIERDVVEDNRLENPNVIVKNIKNDSKIANQFQGFLSDETMLTRSTQSSESMWDFNNMKGVSNPDENKFVYMISSKDNPNLILGGCSNDENNIETFFIFEKNGEVYTVKDEVGEPIFDAKIDMDKGEILLVNVYTIGPMTRADLNAWCGVGMGVAGGVATAFIPLTLGASIGFAACWGIVAGLMC